MSEGVRSVHFTSSSSALAPRTSGCRTCQNSEGCKERTGGIDERTTINEGEESVKVPQHRHYGMFISRARGGSCQKRQSPPCRLKKMLGHPTTPIASMTSLRRHYFHPRTPAAPFTVVFPPIYQPSHCRVTRDVTIYVLYRHHRHTRLEIPAICSVVVDQQQTRPFRCSRSQLRFKQHRPSSTRTKSDLLASSSSSSLDLHGPTGPFVVDQ